MEEKKICHAENAAFLDALFSCLASGLSVLKDGEALTPETLRELSASDEFHWEGRCLQNEKGKLTGISFRT